MWINIDSNHPIFKSLAYQKDVVPFNLVEVVKSSAKMLVSDEKSYIICSMLHQSVPTWVWTENDIDAFDLNNLCQWIYENFSDSDNAYFVAKPYTAAAIAEKYIHEKNAAVHRIQMESFECLKLIPVKNADVVIGKAAPDDLHTIAEFCRCFSLECFGRETTVEDSIKEAEEFISRSKAFVICQNGKAVAMAKSARETERHISINGVYTMPEHRGKGFATALVAHICSLIIAEGKTPMLYTDLSNPSSNKAYTNVGFIPRGRVDEIKLEWSKHHVQQSK